MPAKKIVQRAWFGGMNSAFHPSMLPQTQYAYGENVLNRGGMVQTRPGLKYLAGFLGSIAQGGCFFTPTAKDTRAVIAVDGFIYTASAPFTTFTKLEGLAFDPTAPYIVFKSTIQSVVRSNLGELRVINPKTVLMIQDGTTQAAWWDGATAAHLSIEEPFLGTPIGTWMEWTGSRLWVASGSSVTASDIGNPLAFSENTYLAEKSNFELPGDCTGLIETADRTGLLAFTDETVTAFKSSIHKRSDWQITPDFQQYLVNGSGCVAGKSAINHYGITYWYSKRGFISLNSALYTQRNAELPSEDEEMARSKHNLSPIKTGVCAGRFENFLAVSVPSGSRYNAHTWVMDQSPGEIGAGGDRAWASVWTGFRPVEWITGTVNGEDRCLALCFDATVKDGTQIHLWEAFQTSREDNNGAIACQFETGILDNPDLMRFNFAEIEVCQLIGRVALKVFAGGVKGPWMLIYDSILHAEPGSIGSSYQQVINILSVIEAFRPQHRTVITQELSLPDILQPAETKSRLGIDTGFALLFEWRGRMGIRAFQATVTDAPEKTKGACSPSENNTHFAINDRGETIR